MAKGDMKNCTPLWRQTRFQVKMFKIHHSQSTFGSSDVEKLHAAVARSAFASQTVKKLTVSEHFWKFRCRKIARAVARSTFASQNAKRTDGPGPILEIQMLKNCTPL